MYVKALARHARVIVGCVVNDAYVSSDGYRISPRYKDGRAVDLRPFEGRKVTIDGLLLPGDHFMREGHRRRRGAFRESLRVRGGLKHDPEKSGYRFSEKIMLKQEAGAG
jgi:hypothetical protein